MKQSALYHLHAASGAVFAEHHGWQIPAVFSKAESEAEGVKKNAGLADLSYRAKFEGKARGETGWLRLNSHRCLTIGEPPLDPPAGTVDVTSVYANLFLAGPRSRDVIGKLTSLKVSDDALANHAAGQASLAHTHAIVVREDIGELPAFHILISREYAESVWESIAHAGHEFHLKPFGIRALELLRT
jgi:glycine cleavage system aminomethyltransferase T